MRGIEGRSDNLNDFLREPWGGGRVQWHGSDHDRPVGLGQLPTLRQCGAMSAVLWSWVNSDKNYSENQEPMMSIRDRA